MKAAAIIHAYYSISEENSKKKGQYRQSYPMEGPVLGILNILETPKPRKRLEDSKSLLEKAPCDSKC